jgi:hypothetical protein
MVPALRRDWYYPMLANTELPIRPMTRRIPKAAVAAASAALSLLLAAVPARAILDIEDRGPVLQAGRWAMRVTNAGILGNAFFDAGLCFDPSFEYPRGSGQEMLNHAELWVGARTADGWVHVSGGPTLEFRPTLAPEDHVRVAWRDRLGARRLVDDDGDGRVDEEALNGRDDDGDGEVDEDLGMFSQQMASAEYVDDRPEAVDYVYANGERHTPLGLSVEQRGYAWSYPTADRVAAFDFTITNHGSQELHDLQIGLWADLDVRQRLDRMGHLNDQVRTVSYSRTIPLGTSRVTVRGQPQQPASINCTKVLRQTLPVIVDGDARSGMPAVAVLPLGHTTDPLADMDAARAYARAPSTVAFRSSVFLRGLLPGSGGPPLEDGQRYDALSGADAGSDGVGEGDWAVLVACGPFSRLAPGESIDFTVALVAADRPESLAVLLADAAQMQFGTTINALRDSTGPYPRDWDQGVSGLNGHDACIEPPVGVTFQTDPHCSTKLRGESIPPGLDNPVVYRHGACIWTDTDCDECTGMDGRETVLRWLGPGEVPPSPRVRLSASDHAIEIAWDNRPEVLLAGGQSGTPQSRFLGYRVYRIADWDGRQSLVPPPEHWALFGAYASDTLNGQVAIGTVTDTTLDYERILYERKVYPPGRYHVRDTAARNGFTYLYAVTSLYELVVYGASSISHRVLESPLVASFDEAVVPRADARDHAGSVWVVPNPFRAHAGWDLPPVDGDRLTRHLDFMGLPRARCTIRIWTAAGDLVANLDHDGSLGDGEARWDLVSRNGQEVASGIYVFTVDSDLGRQTGRFVVIR